MQRSPTRLLGCSSSTSHHMRDDGWHEDGSLSSCVQEETRNLQLIPRCVIESLEFRRNPPPSPSLWPFDAIKISPLMTFPFGPRILVARSISCYIYKVTSDDAAADDDVENVIKLMSPRRQLSRAAPWWRAVQSCRRQLVISAFRIDKWGWEGVSLGK